jgi:hypothetical protein
MSLRKLIRNQTIRIDDHFWGNREQKNWDDPKKDVHIDKTTNVKVNGKRQKLQIRIPINSERPIKIGNKLDKMDSIPRGLEREIQDALENKVTRDAFIADLIKILEEFPSSLENEERAKNILDRLSKHFHLDWTGEKTATYARDALQYYAQTYSDSNGLLYFITIDKMKIEVGQNNGYAKYFKKYPQNNSSM